MGGTIPRNLRSPPSLFDLLGGGQRCKRRFGMNPPFDAVLIVSFGGPQKPEDIRPFLANVLRGRRISPERIEEVAHHYELFGGYSPLTEITRLQADGLKSRIERLNLPV